MSKEELIESIRRHNPTAGSAFLAGFDEPALKQYLHHLHYREGPRGPHNMWVRRGDTPAIVGRHRPWRAVRSRRAE